VLSAARPRPKWEKTSEHESRELKPNSRIKEIGPRGSREKTGEYGKTEYSVILRLGRGIHCSTKGKMKNFVQPRISLIARITRTKRLKTSYPQIALICADYDWFRRGGPVWPPNLSFPGSTGQSIAPQQAQRKTLSNH
jgi:hypothetical protein